MNNQNGISPKSTTDTRGAINTGNGINHMNGFHMNGFHIWNVFSAEKVISYRNGMS